MSGVVDTSAAPVGAKSAARRLLFPSASVNENARTDALEMRATECPSCGLVTADGPHATSGQCIRALEAEMQRLSDLLDRVKAHQRRLAK
jgi:hypothetical protein